MKSGEVRVGTSGRGTSDTRKACMRSGRRKAHHHLMVVTYADLRPGTDYHIRIAGVNGAGQVSWNDFVVE